MDPQTQPPQPQVQPPAPPPGGGVPLPPAEENPIQAQLAQSQQIPVGQPAEPQYNDPAAVALARSKIAAAHQAAEAAQPATPQPPFQTAPAEPLAPDVSQSAPWVPAAPAPVQPETSPPAPTPAPSAPVAPAPAVNPVHGNYMPKQDFDTFELPPEDEEPPAPPAAPAAPQAADPEPQAVAPTPPPQPIPPPTPPPPPAPPAPVPEQPPSPPPVFPQPPAPSQPEPQQPVPPAVATPPTPPQPAPTVAQVQPETPPESTPAPAPAEPSEPKASVLSRIKKRLQNFYQGKPKLPSRLKPILGAALTGMAIFLLFNSQVLVGQLQYLTNAGSDAAASTETVSADPLIIIPKINVSVPVVYDVKTFHEPDVEVALQRGVVHYGTTALPGEIGNNVIVGHSSNNWWASGKYKFAFVLLDKLEVGDTFELHYNSKRYIYKVYNKKIVDPKDVSVLQPTTTAETTLITCTPPGTSLHRLVIQSKQISPDPSTDQAASATSQQSVDQLAGSPPSLWTQIKQRLFGND